MGNNKFFRPDFKTLCELLNRYKVRYLVLGAWAWIIYGLPRTTLDVDIIIDKTEENCQKLIESLSNIGAGIAKELTPNEILKTKVFMFADMIKVDIFTETYGVKNFNEVYKRSKEVNFEGIKIPVISYKDFLKTKNTDRPKDKEDLKILKKLKVKF